MEERKAIVQLKNITKSFGDNQVLKPISLDIYEGEFLTLLGSSGCGKTTTLRIIAGFETPTEGNVYIEDKDVTELAPYNRDVNTVFQSYALFPHMTVFDNIAFGLVEKKMDKKKIKKKVLEMLDLVQLHGFEKRKPSQMSGGQKQRVAIARALVNSPKVLLLDEPLGALDLKMRKEMQLELKSMHERLGITFIYVTHDQEEALTMSDKIVVMSEGRMQQIGTPEDIYNEPKNAFVADFIGESNIFTGIMTDKLKVRFCGAEFACVDDVEHGRLVEVVVRPEDVEITTPENGAITGTVTSVVFKGVHYEITVESGKNEIVIQSTKTAAVGSQVGLNVEPDGIHIMIPEHTLNKIESDVDKNYELTIFDGKIQCDLTKIIPGSKFNDAHELLDAHGDVIDYEKLKVVLAIKPRHISMSDNEEEGIVCGHIINLIYKGDHYSYVVRTDMDEDFIVNDEYLWNMDDYVSLVIPEEHIQFSIKK